MTRRANCLALLLCAGLTAPVVAQDAPPGETSGYDELSQLLDSIQTRVDGMNANAKDTDAAMKFLTDQIEEAIQKLSTRDTEVTALRETAAGLSQELEAIADNRDDLGTQVTRLTEEKDEIFNRLENQVRELASLLSLEREVTTNLRRSLEERSSDLRMSLDERELIAADLGKARKALSEQKSNSEEQLLRLAALEKDKAELRDERAAAEASLATSSKTIETTQASLDTALARNQELDSALVVSTAELESLTQQLGELRRQIAELGALLQTSEDENQAQQAVIDNLGRRLNLALANKVRELARYRSEFFGRLREVLGERSDVQVVGDRFVFQSEVLFHSAAAELEPEGRAQLRQLAQSLKQISATIPDGIDWVLRIDGHTDERPIQTPRFPSNWELSTARAIAVVKFLVEQGVPSERVMAAGFAQFRPLDTGDDEAAFRRNRRIEFRLTQK